MKPSAIYVWLVPSEEVQEQPGGWRIRKWDTEPFLKANFTLSETGMPGNGNTPTTREGSAAAPGKAGTEARQESLGDKHGLVDRACSYLQDLESPFSDEEAVTLCAMLRSHVAQRTPTIDITRDIFAIVADKFKDYPLAVRAVEECQARLVAAALTVGAVPTIAESASGQSGPVIRNAERAPVLLDVDGEPTLLEPGQELRVRA
jgi:hypothetical protein